MFIISSCGYGCFIIMYLYKWSSSQCYESRHARDATTRTSRARHLPTHQQTLLSCANTSLRCHCQQYHICQGALFYVPVISEIGSLVSFRPLHQYLNFWQCMPFFKFGRIYAVHLDLCTLSVVLLSCAVHFWLHLSFLLSSHPCAWYSLYSWTAMIGGLCGICVLDPFSSWQPWAYLDSGRYDASELMALLFTHSNSSY